MEEQLQERREMKLLKLTHDAFKPLLELAESGMDFTIIMAFCERIPFDGVLVVRGNGYAAPIERVQDIYSVVDMYAGVPSPIDIRRRERGEEFNLEIQTQQEELRHTQLQQHAIEIADLKNIRLPSPSFLQSLLTTVSLPPGYVPTPGAHPLLGLLTLSATMTFYRFTWTVTDGRYQPCPGEPAVGQLRPGTYLTTDNDEKLANTGFGVVGRYALPMPMPASYKHEYEISTGALLVGTVAPAFGQAGGGVEVMTTQATSVTFKGTKRIDDC